MSIIKKLLSRIRGEQDLNKLVKRGLVIGKNCKLGSCTIDPSHCFHIKIGDNVTFGPHVHILAHDASTKTFIGYTRVANVSIGNNVFIGANSTVLPGVTIGNNVIIGAGSIVSHNIPENTVAAGCPAKVIKHLSEYLEKRQAEITADNCFDEEYTLRNTQFNEHHKKALISACIKNNVIYVQ